MSRKQFRKVFKEYYRPLCQFFSNRGCDLETCRDLAQETLMRAYRGAGEFREDASFKTWLFQIAHNVFRNSLRHRSARKRDARVLSIDEASRRGQPFQVEEDVFSEEPIEDPLESLLEKERAALLRGAIDGLPGQMKRCLLLRMDGDLKYREIASLLSLSIETVKSQLHQARQRLRKVLKDELED